MGRKRRLRMLEWKVKILETKADELSKKIEAQDGKNVRIGKIVSLGAEILTIVAGIIAIMDHIS